MDLMDDHVKVQHRKEDNVIIVMNDWSLLQTIWIKVTQRESAEGWGLV